MIIKGQMSLYTMIEADFNTLHTSVDKSYSSPKKINKKISELNCTIDHMDSTNIYRIFHRIAVEYTFFSVAYGTFP